MAVVGEQLPGDGKGADVAAQGVEIPVNQPQRLTAQADGRLRLAEPKLVVRQRMLLIKGNGEGGMIADAKVQLVCVPVFHRQLVVQGVALQGEGGNQPERIGEHPQCFLIAAQLQHDGVFRLTHQHMLHQPGEAVLFRLVYLALRFNQAVHNLSGVGEQNGRVIAPDALVRLPHVLHVIVFPDDAFHLGAPGGDGDDQILIFNCVFHYFCSFSRSRISVRSASSLLGLGGLAGAASSFFLPSSVSLFRLFTRKNTTSARIRKLITAEMKLP